MEPTDIKSIKDLEQLLAAGVDPTTIRKEHVPLNREIAEFLDDYESTQRTLAIMALDAKLLSLERDSPEDMFADDPTTADSADLIEDNSLPESSATTGLPANLDPVPSYLRPAKPAGANTAVPSSGQRHVLVAGFAACLLAALTLLMYFKVLHPQSTRVTHHLPSDRVQSSPSRNQASFSLTSGQVVHVRLGPDSGDVRVCWNAPSGDIREGYFYSDDPPRIREWIGLAEEDGRYQLTFIPDKPESLEWEVTAQRQATDADRLQAQANTAIHQARIFRAVEQTPYQAVAAYDQAMGNWRQLGDIARASDALNGQGMVLIQLNEYQAALANFEEALSLRHQTDDHFGIAQALNNIGLAYQYLGNPNQAIPYYQLALELAHDLPPILGTGFMQQRPAWLSRIGSAIGNLDWSVAGSDYRTIQCRRRFVSWL